LFIVKNNTNYTWGNSISFAADSLSHLAKYVCEPDGFELEFNEESNGLLESL